MNLIYKIYYLGLINMSAFDKLLMTSFFAHGGHRIDELKNGFYSASHKFERIYRQCLAYPFFCAAKRIRKKS